MSDKRMFKGKVRALNKQGRKKKSKPTPIINPAMRIAFANASKRINVTEE